MRRDAKMLLLPSPAIHFIFSCYAVWDKLTLITPTGKAYQVDVISPEAVEKAIVDIVKEFNGRLDIFVANSGIAWEEGAFIDGSVETARKVMAVNVDGVMWCAKSAGAHFRRQKKEGTTLDGKPLDGFLAGSFIATASMSGSIVNIPQLQAVYNGSKAAVIHFCRSLAVEWTGFARVNTVSPGYIRTEILNFAPKETRDQWKNKTPMGCVAFLFIDFFTHSFIYRHSHRPALFLCLPMMMGTLACSI